MEVLVAEHAGQDCQLPAGKIVPNVLDERLNALRVVSAIDDEHRVLAHQLKSARPAHRLDALADLLVRDLPAALLKHARRGQRNGGIVELVLAEKRQTQGVKTLPVKDLTLERVREQMQRVEIRLVQRRIQRLAAFLEHRLDRRTLTVEHCVAAGLDDTGLGAGDLLQRVAQHFGVVETDVADHGSLRRRDDVRRVELAAHADLADNDVALVAGEILKADGCDHLKLGRALEDGFREWLYILGQLADIRIGDLFAVDLNALVEADEIRRGVQTGLVARLAQDGGDHRAGRALAVGAGHMDEFAFAFGVSHGVQKRLYALKAGNGALPANLMNITQSFIKSHDLGLPSVKTVKNSRDYSLSSVFCAAGQRRTAVKTLDL